MGPVHLFVSYAPADRPLRQRLESHLSPLVRQGRLVVWHRDRIELGDDHDEVIQQELSRAQGILLLLSADFFADDDCDQDLTQALEFRKTRPLRIIPILLRPCRYGKTPIASFKSLPEKPVTEYQNEDHAWAEISSAIQKQIGEIQRASIPPSSNATPPASVPSSSSEAMLASPPAPLPWALAASLVRTVLAYLPRPTRKALLMALLCLAAATMAFLLLPLFSSSSHYPELALTPPLDGDTRQPFVSFVEGRVARIIDQCRLNSSIDAHHVCLRMSLANGLVTEVFVLHPSDPGLRECIVRDLRGKAMSLPGNEEITARIQWP